MFSSSEYISITPSALPNSISGTPELETSYTPILAIPRGGGGGREREGRGGGEERRREGARGEKNKERSWKKDKKCINKKEERKEREAHGRVHNVDKEKCGRYKRSCVYPSVSIAEGEREWEYQ